MAIFEIVFESLAVVATKMLVLPDQPRVSGTAFVLLNRCFSLILSCAILSCAACAAPAWCAEATTEQKLILLKAIDADLAKKPNDTLLLLKHAEMMGLLQRYVEQADEANKLIRKNPNLRDAYLIRFDGEVNQRLYAEALVSLDMACKLGAPTPKLLLSKARCLKNAKRYQEAIETLNQLIKIEPSNVAAYDCRSICYFRLYGPCEKALQDLEKIVVLNPADLKAKSLAADLKRELKQNSALETAKTANDNVTLLKHAEMMGRMKRFDVEVSESTKVIQNQPNNREAYLIQAHGLGNLDRSADAIKSLDKAFSLGPPTPELLVLKATHLRHEKNYDEAVKILTEVIQKNPNYSAAYDCRSVCYYRLYGPCTLALNDLEMESRLEPQNAEVKTLIDELKKKLKVQ